MWKLKYLINKSTSMATGRQHDISFKTLAQNAKPIIDKDSNLTANTIVAEGDIFIAGDIYGNIIASETTVMGDVLVGGNIYGNFVGDGGGITGIVTDSVVVNDGSWTVTDYFPNAIIWTNPFPNTWYVITNGLWGTRIQNRASITVSNFNFTVNTRTATFTTGQNFVGIYLNGSLIASSADQTTAWAGATSDSLITVPLLQAPVTIGPGAVDLVICLNKSAGNFMLYGDPLDPKNHCLASPNLRSWTCAGTSLPTTLPAQTAIVSIFMMLS
jgi:hypothetical protein